jgi:hypothetical protein
MAKASALVLAAVVILGSGPARGQSFGTPQAEKFFRVEWQAQQTKNGQPAIGGFVYNDYGNWAGDVRLLVEGLDASGRPVSLTRGYVNGEVPPRGRVPFEVILPAPAATYRVTVEYFFWRHRGGA